MNIEQALKNLESAVIALRKAYDGEKSAKIQNQDRDFETVNTELSLRF